MNYCIDQCRHQARAHQPQVHGARWTSSSTPSWSTWKTCKDRPTTADKRDRLPSTATCCPRRSWSAGSACKSVKPDDVLTIIFTSRLDRQAQGRDAHLCQHRLATSAAHRPGRPPERPSDVSDRHLAVLPFVRLHGDAVGRGRASTSRGPTTSARSTPRQIGKLIARSQGHDPALHAHVPAHVPAALRAGGFQDARRGRLRRREAADGLGRRVREEVRRAARSKATAPPSCRRSSRSTSRRAAAVDNFQADRKEGTVGRRVPGVTAKRDRSRHGQADWSAGESGMLLDQAAPT